MAPVAPVKPTAPESTGGVSEDSNSATVTITGDVSDKSDTTEADIGLDNTNVSSVNAVITSPADSAPVVDAEVVGSGSVDGTLSNQNGTTVVNI